MRYKIKKWDKFQHFKDRRPPWIKLYRDLLNDPDWHELHPKDAKILVMLWLVASECKEKKGRLPELRKLSFRLRIKESELKQSITNLSSWLMHDDVKLISKEDQGDTPETETETEGEGEGETDKPCPHLKIIELYNSLLGNKLTKVKPTLWNGTRKGDLSLRWKEDKERQDIDWWKDLFKDISESKFLTGDNDRGWVADLGWILKQSNIIKIIEGKYSSRKSNNNNFGGAK